MALVGVTETAPSARDVVSALVLEELQARAVLLPSLTNVSADIIKGANKVSIQKFAELTAESKAENTSLTAQALALTQTELSLDKQKASLVSVEEIASEQSALDFESGAMRQIARSIVQGLEAEANTVLQAASASSPDHRVEYASTNELAKADILNARKLLAIQNVPMDDRDNLFMALHPSQEADLLGIDGFVHADKYGSSSPVQTGEVGRVYGFRVLISTNVTEDTSLFYHRSHAAYALQNDIMFRENFDTANIANEMVGWAIAGFATLDSGKRGVRVENAV